MLKITKALDTMLRKVTSSNASRNKERVRKHPRLSVIVIVYNMQREAPRTLRSLCNDYQKDVKAEDYEVIVVENGSSGPLPKETVDSLNSNFSYFYLHDPPPSPAYAINFGVSKASGDIIGIMIDGACLLTPGIFRMALKAFRMFDNPIVMTRYFFLGPGRQNITISQGYNQNVEDELLKKIDWPKDGYRLFEIGVPLPRPNSEITPSEYRVIWFSRLFESNCIFFKKETFQRFGGCNEKFDIPGGGFLNLDIFREAARLRDTEVVQLIGEAVFHQVHGGTTTNIPMEDKKLEIERYRKQYREIRKEEYAVPQKPVYLLGRIPNFHAIKDFEG